MSNRKKTKADTGKSRGVDTATYDLSVKNPNGGEAQQKRFSFDDDHFFVDLVFYNRLLRCHVLIDLELDKLTRQDLGQMQRCR